MGLWGLGTIKVRTSRRITEEIMFVHQIRNEFKLSVLVFQNQSQFCVIAQKT